MAGLDEKRRRAADVTASVIASGVEYVDLVSDIADKIPRYGKTKRIVSLHNFDETPENLEEIHANMSKLNAVSSRLPRWRRRFPTTFA